MKLDSPLQRPFLTEAMRNAEIASSTSSASEPKLIRCSGRTNESLVAESVCDEGIDRRLTCICKQFRVQALTAGRLPFSENRKPRNITPKFTPKREPVKL